MFVCRIWKDLVVFSSLANGSALPSWLTFDATSRTYSGTPENADADSLVIEIKAEDPEVSSASVTFGLKVELVESEVLLSMNVQCSMRRLITPVLSQFPSNAEMAPPWSAVVAFPSSEVMPFLKVIPLIPMFKLAFWACIFSRSIWRVFSPSIMVISLSWLMFRLA